MINPIIAFIVDESKWLTVSMGLAFLAVILLFNRYRHSGLPVRYRILTAMNLFFGVTIGTMALGHLLAVTVKLIIGTLEGSILIFYMIGTALAIPSWWLINHIHSLLISENELGRTTLILNTWIAITLLLLGIHNLPLAIPAFLNVGYQLFSHRVVRWTIVSIAVVVHVGLFVGSLIFLASGQSFEQFRGIE